MLFGVAPPTHSQGEPARFGAGRRCPVATDSRATHCLRRHHYIAEKSSQRPRCREFSLGIGSALQQQSMAYKVLVIEDNTDCRELFAMLIRYLGFEVVEAGDGEIGVQKALLEKPDLIFMDIDMPSMSGIKATACLRESGVTKDTPVVMCKAWTEEKHREAALQSGACAVIHKPVSVNELQTVLLRYLPAPKEPLNIQ